ncbi:MAG: hypothetical protein Sv326_1075 [Candidatus Fermentimicrarchaeum limneticum]|uniref:Uncharacterized protein n=1 Tax=Fermentimicrarchaeum limneticum TaxID=2795018 RepID=A0A7D5XK63_FERL1|nr:MAG: hypothetical protein Sv326_1075 [Candidatus Fermentimicrarchaeum limneticum]
MVWARKPLEEKPDFKEVKARPWERFADHFREHPQKPIVTSFGRNHLAMEEFGRRLLEFKDKGERVIINEIGLGIEERNKLDELIKESGVVEKLSLIERGVKRVNISFEPFELLNQIRNAGITPEEFTLYAMDIRQDVLLAVKSSKVLKIRLAGGDGEYFKRFFPEFHGKEEKGFWRVVSVKIPKEYRERIVCPKPLDIEKGPAPVKADITFSFIYGGSVSSEEAYLGNLIESTKEGGYVMCWGDFNEKVADRFNVERIPISNYFVRVYRVR